MSKKVYTSFAELDGVFSSATIKPYKHMTVRPVRRTYLSERDAVYDYTVGHDMLVIDTNSPFFGCTVSTLDANILRQHGYTHVQIAFNPGLEPTTVELR